MNIVNRFGRRSIRAKVTLLISFWAGLMLTGATVNGILNIKVEADQEVLSRVRRVRTLSDDLVLSAVSVMEGDTGIGAGHLTALADAYSVSLMELVPKDQSIVGEISFSRDKMILPFFISRRLSTPDIRESVKQLNERWAAYRPSFESLIRGSDGIRRQEIIAVRGVRTTAEDFVDSEASAGNQRVEELLTQNQVQKIRDGQRLIGQINMVVIVGGVASAILVILMFGRFVFLPLENLRKVTERFARDDLDARARIFHEDDEPGKLAKSFNTMAAAVQERNRVVKEKLAEIRNMNEELLKASKMKSHFLATMSHELRTPMNSIIGYSDLLLDGIDGELNDEQREDVKSVLRSAEHLLKLINDVLDLSKIEAGHMKVEIEEVNIREAMEEVIESIEPLVTEKGLRHEVIYLDQDVLVKADPDRVRQIVLNLLSNAVKFTDTGGVTTRIMKDDKHGIISVEDTGIGIPEGHLKSIFEEFQQVDGATTRKHGGTGLGLAIVRRLVDLMGGNVSVSSQLGAGSIFHVKLPLANPKVVDAPEIFRAVLLVDDDPETIGLFGRYLAEVDVGVVAARTVSEAKLMLRDAQAGKPGTVKPIAVLLDLRLPDASGYDLLRHIRADPYWKKIPVGVVSVADDDGQSGAIGADAHLVKPINRADLIELSRTLLSRADRVQNEIGPRDE